jgi:hypothetical protein
MMQTWLSFIWGFPMHKANLDNLVHGFVHCNHLFSTVWMHFLCQESDLYDNLHSDHAKEIVQALASPTNAAIHSELLKERANPNQRQECT